jgi:hypothetical protein
MKKSTKLACHVENSNIAVGFFADTPNVAWTVSVI